MINSIHEQLAYNIRKKQHDLRISRRIKYQLQNQIKKQKKQIFGKFFNYDIIKFNKQKKYMLQEEHNTEIERENRLLFEKIQNIKKRSLSWNRVTRMPTENHNQPTNHIDRYHSLPSQGYHHPKVIIFRGKRVISDQICYVLIFTHKEKYTIMVERGKIQQKIQIPIQQYKVLLRQNFKGNHQKIFQYININASGYIQLLGVNNLKTQIVQYGELKLP